jgi:hypothetical protein
LVLLFSKFSLSGKLFSQNFQDFLFPSGNLNLRHSKYFCRLCLCFAFVIPKFYKHSVFFIQIRNCFYYRKPLRNFIFRRFNRNISLTSVPLADNLTSDEAQIVNGTFIVRTSGGGASKSMIGGIIDAITD